MANQLSNADDNMSQFGNALTMPMPLANGNNHKMGMNMGMNMNTNTNTNMNPMAYGMGNGANMYDGSGMMNPPSSTGSSTNNSKLNSMNKHPNRNNIPPIHPSLLH